MAATAIIILEFNNAKDTLNCVKSVVEHNSADVKFVIVDNASSDKNIVREIETGLWNIFPTYSKSDIVLNPSGQILPPVSIIVSQENKGYAGGNNIGLNAVYNDSKIENVMILNSDILFMEDIIPSLIADLKDGVALVSPILYKRDLKGFDLNCSRRELTKNEILKLHFPFPADPWKISKKRKLPFKENTGLFEIQLPSGSCMIAKKEVFQKLGGFDENTFLYFEEDILWEKIKRAGLRNYLDTNVKCIHLGGTTTSRNKSRFIVNTSVKSAQYLLNAYKNPNILQRVTMSLFRMLIDFRMRGIELYKKYKNR